MRGVVAQTSFDQFHKHSVDIIQESVFGRNQAGEINDRLVFTSNNLVVTNIDIQSVEPVDQRTRDSRTFLMLMPCNNLCSTKIRAISYRDYHQEPRGYC